jgi:UDP-N-acetyl-2-amino-2-deoxyglucuronate dehydrogenase
MIHIGLIGAGNISDTHARAAAAIEGVAVSAVYARHSDRANQLAERHGARAYTDFDAFLAHKPMDLVAIGTPSGLHAAHGIAAAQRGLHVLVEKPIDVTAARADALIEAARASGVTLGVFFQDRFAPGVCALKELVDEGRLGRPLLASARVKWFRPSAYYAASTWRGTRTLDGGGALINQGVHTVDLLLWLLGPVRRVVARTATVLHDIEVEDTAVAILEFESGAVATLEATTAAFPGYPRRIELSGTEGTAILEENRLIAVDLRAAGSSAGRPDPIGSSKLENINPARPIAPALQAASSPVVADASGHRAVIEDFIEAIAANRAPRCDGAEGRRSVALVEAIYESARLGAAVEPRGPDQSSASCEEPVVGRKGRT